MERYDCVVIGGGVAGIAAAVEVQASGLSVLLLEKRHTLGGRASSFGDATTGMVVDACQHVNLGCCTRFQRLLTQLGVGDRIRYLDAIEFASRGGARSSLRAAPLPAPYHLLPSLLGLPWLSLRDKVSAARLLAAARRVAGASELAGHDFASYAGSTGASPDAMRRLFDPLIVSACNAHSEAVSASYGVKVLNEALCASRTGYRIGLPTMPIAEIFSDVVRDRLPVAGGCVRTGTTVLDVTTDGAGNFVVSAKGGARWRAQAVIVAVNFDALPRLVPREFLTPAQRGAPALLRHAPIVAVHLWLDSPPACPEALCLLDTRTHWVFNKTVTFQLPATAPAYWTALASADTDLAAMDFERIRDVCLADLHACIPGMERAVLRHWRVVREHRATFVPYPGVDSVRPSQHTNVRRFAVAGEWTSTGWPSTMEGACRSGGLAASAILSDLAR